jgi:hypothetical protein
MNVREGCRAEAPRGAEAGVIPRASARQAKLFFSTLASAKYFEIWRRCGGSIEPISVVRDSFREEQLLQPLLVVERGLHP